VEAVEALLVALSVFGVSVVAAVSQVLPVDPYLAGVGLFAGGVGVWLVALAAGAGHGLGKMAWYEVGRVAHRWDRFRRWLDRPRVKVTYARWLVEFEKRPRLVLLMLGASALVGLPPLAVTPTIAGQLRTSRWATFLIITAGRTVRYAVLLGAFIWLVP
jgi:membrane protein YqaA with SNARE-associated domain